MKYSDCAFPSPPERRPGRPAKTFRTPKAEAIARDALIRHGVRKDQSWLAPEVDAAIRDMAPQFPKGTFGIPMPKTAQKELQRIIATLP